MGGKESVERKRCWRGKHQRRLARLNNDDSTELRWSSLRRKGTTVTLNSSSSFLNGTLVYGIVKRSCDDTWLQTLPSPTCKVYEWMKQTHEGTQTLPPINSTPGSDWLWLELYLYPCLISSLSTDEVYQSDGCASLYKVIAWAPNTLQVCQLTAVKVFFNMGLLKLLHLYIVESKHLGRIHILKKKLVWHSNAKCYCGVQYRKLFLPPRVWSTKFVHYNL